MRNIRVAKRYARSLFEVALDAHALEDVKASIELFTSAFNASAALRALLRNPVIPAVRKDAALEAIFAGRVHPIVRAFFKLVCLKGRENLLDQIAEQFIVLYNEHSGIVTARVTAAIELSVELQRRVEEFIAERFGGKPVVEYFVDPSIIGGLIICCNDIRLDASIAGQLARMRRYLLSPNGNISSTTRI